MLAILQEGRPRSRSYEATHRVADRYETAVARAFLRAIERLKGRISVDELAKAIASGSILLVDTMSGLEDLGTILATTGLADLFTRTSRASGHAAMEILSDALGFDISFNDVDPRVVLAARQQTANLIVAVSETAREAVRTVTALGAEVGLTTRQQAVAIREVVGLPPNWARAPLNLARDIRQGDDVGATARRLSAADKARIRSRIARGTVSEEFVEEMQQKYAASLTNRRALNIARTETARAAVLGQQEGWRQAVKDGWLPATARMIWIVTSDDRLRETHAQVPLMNPEGVPIDGVFLTPLGPSAGPPLEVNCRCGTGLVFPGMEGVL